MKFVSLEEMAKTFKGQRLTVLTEDEKPVDYATAVEWHAGVISVRATAPDNLEIITTLYTESRYDDEEEED